MVKGGREVSGGGGGGVVDGDNDVSTGGDNDASTGGDRVGDDAVILGVGVVMTKARYSLSPRTIPNQVHFNESASSRMDNRHGTSTHLMRLRTR